MLIRFGITEPRRELQISKYLKFSLVSTVIASPGLCRDSGARRRCVLEKGKSDPTAVTAYAPASPESGSPPSSTGREGSEFFQLGNLGKLFGFHSVRDRRGPEWPAGGGPRTFLRSAGLRRVQRSCRATSTASRPSPQTSGLAPLKQLFPPRSKPSPQTGEAGPRFRPWRPGSLVRRDSAGGGRRRDEWPAEPRGTPLTVPSSFEDTEEEESTLSPCVSKSNTLKPRRTHSRGRLPRCRSLSCFFTS